MAIDTHKKNPATIHAVERTNIDTSERARATISRVRALL